MKRFYDLLQTVESRKLCLLRREPIYEARLRAYVANPWRHKPIKSKGKAQAWFARLLAADCNDNSTITIRYR